MANQHPVCRHCHSPDVVVDAWASWDGTTQQWVLDQTFDNSFCNTCQNDTKLEWNDGEPPEPDECPKCQGETYSFMLCPNGDEVCHNCFDQGHG